MLQQNLHNMLINFIKKMSYTIVGEGTDQSLVNINYLHNKIHKGEMLFVSHTFLAVPNNGIVYFRHLSGATKYLHSQLELATTGEWSFTSYAGTTYTADGTLLPPINRKSDSTYVPESLFYHTPTIDDLGTPRLVFHFGSGNNPAQATTGLFAERLESEFAPGVQVLIALQNLSGTAQNISGVFNYYEEA